MDDKEKDIKIDLKWLDDTLAKLNGTSQIDMFKDDFYYDNRISSAGAGTISQAVGNTYPYISTSTGNYVLTNSNGTSNISPGLGLSFNDTWDYNHKQSLSVKGDAEFDGDVKIKGKSIVETLEKIEKRLAILHPNEKLEDKWEKLKELGDAYRALEKDILEKEMIWEKLKK